MTGANVIKDTEESQQEESRCCILDTDPRGDEAVPGDDEADGGGDEAVAND